MALPKLTLCDNSFGNFFFFFVIREMYFGILFLKPHRVRKWSRIIPMSKTWGELLVFDKRRGSQLWFELARIC